MSQSYQSNENENDLPIRQRGNGSSRAGFEKREKRRNIRQLQGAIAKGDVMAVKEILIADFDVDFQYNGQTSLQLAVCKGVEPICAMLIAKGANVNQADASGNSLLNMACWRGYADVAELLVNNRADLDSQNESGNSSLNVCAAKGFTQLVNILLSSKCNTNLANKNGFAPLHTASQTGDIQIIQQLLQAGADPDWLDHGHRTPLMLASEAGHVGAVQALVLAGANTNLQSRHGHTAVFEAASAGHIHILEELVRHNADLNLSTTRGLTPLLAAISADQIGAAQILIESGCNVNQADRMHQAPIHVLVRQISSMFMASGDPDRHSLVLKLVEAGADVNRCDADGCTALYHALQGGCYDLCKYLLDKRASVTAVTASGSSMLHAAVYSSKYNLVQLCLESGCVVNAVDDSGQHALLAAVASRCDFQILELLLKAGSDVNIAKTRDRQTALHEAVCQHYEAAVTLLVDHGSLLSAENLEKKTPLYLACQRGLTQSVEYMLRQPDCPMSSTYSSALPIHAAASQGRAATIETLSQHGCNINEMNEKGDTPITAALREDNFSSARALLQCGSDLEYHSKLKGLQLCCLHHDDPHPHLAQEPLFLAMTHKNMDMMNMLLTCYRTIPLRVIHLLSMLLRRSQGLNTHYTDKQKQEILELFFRSVRTPFSLSDACRRHIRACLSSPIHAKVKDLPIGEKVKKYLLMEDEFETWKEMEQLMPGGSAGFSNIYIHRERW